MGTQGASVEPDAEISARQEPLDSLGFRLRDIRRRRSLTLQELSQASGVSVGMLSQIERGLSSPSIRTLQRVSEALEVPIGWFFSTARDTADGPAWVLRRTARQVLALGGQGVTKELLSPPGIGAIELLLVTVEPGGSSGTAPYTHAGEDAGLVLEGTLRLEVAGEPCALGAGDSFRFVSTLPHRFENPGPVRAVVLWALTPPFY
jgi:transcriptional regulator with XRE-family HTH domain